MGPRLTDERLLVINDSPEGNPTSLEVSRSKIRRGIKDNKKNLCGSWKFTVILNQNQCGTRLMLEEKIARGRKGFQLMAEPLQKEAIYKPTRFNGLFNTRSGSKPIFTPRPSLRSKHSNLFALKTFKMLTFSQAVYPSHNNLQLQLTGRWDMSMNNAPHRDLYWWHTTNEVLRQFLYIDFYIF